jgi:hypothetical protein
MDLDAYPLNTSRPALPFPTQLVHLPIACLRLCTPALPLVTPGFKGQIWVHLIYALRKNNTHNNRVHRDKCHKYHKYTYYIAEVLQK